MAMAGLYRRILPSPPAIDFASPEGKLLFSEAFQSGAMEGFFKLISYFQTQSEPAYCGLASLSMVLNALAIDPGRKWKGPWRWFDESMLDCCEPLEKVKAEGISFGKVVCLAQCAGAKVDAFRTNQSTIEDFRKFVIACTARDDCHVVSSYDRGKFKQTGSGHFSPIGGYHAGKDMALILDVARFKYPPHWVPVTLLWEAMNTVDKASGLHRGFMLVSRLHRAPALLYTLSCKHESWIKIAKYLVEDVPFLLGSEDVRDIKKAISVLLSSLPSDFGEFIKWVAEVRRQENGGGQSLSEEEKGRLADKEEVLRQVQETVLYTRVTEFLLSEQQTSGTATFTSLGNKLPEVAAKVCCQGAGFFSGMPGSLNSLCYRQTCVRCFQYTGENSVTVVSGTVVNENGEQGIDMLVPSSPRHKKRCDCKPDDDALGMYPMSNDILTVLLLALPPQTWSGIQEENLLQEIQALVSTENLPMLLQEEVLHLRRQLHILKRCKDNKNGHSLPYTISEDAKHTTISHITEGNKGEASVFHQNVNCSLKCHIMKCGVRVANPGKLILCGSSGINLHLLSASSRFKCMSTCARPGFEKPFVCLRNHSPL